MQRKINLIKNWLSTSDVVWDQWEYDGKELSILVDGNVVETYTNINLSLFIQQWQKSK